MLEETQELTLVIDEQFIKFLKQVGDIKALGTKQEIYVNRLLYTLDYTIPKFTVKNSDYWVRKSEIQY